jgi:hypothetical protein
MWWAPSPIVKDCSKNVEREKIVTSEFVATNLINHQTRNEKKYITIGCETNFFLNCLVFKMNTSWMKMELKIMKKQEAAFSFELGNWAWKTKKQE